MDNLYEVKVKEIAVIKLPQINANAKIGLAKLPPINVKANVETSLSRKAFDDERILLKKAVNPIIS